MIKIAIIGPESTGKTELANQLAEYFHCSWEPELAREYVENLEREYTFDDVCEIARLQIIQEKKYENLLIEDDFIFFDTDIIITKVWFEHKYGVVPEFVTKRLSTRFFDYYLLLEPDLPWVYDPVREHGDDREFFFDWYETEIKKLGTPYSGIKGTGAKRLQHAVQEIKIFASHHTKRK